MFSCTWTGGRGVLGVALETEVMERGTSSAKDSFLNELGEGPCQAEGAAQQRGHV